MEFHPQSHIILDIFPGIPISERISEVESTQIIACVEVEEKDAGETKSVLVKLKIFIRISGD